MIQFKEEYIDFVKALIYAKYGAAIKKPLLDDVVQAGFLGLCKAMHNYTYQHNSSFKHYARFRILGEAVDYLRSMGPVPRRQMDIYKAENAVRNKLEQKLLRKPTVNEMEKEIGQTLLPYRHGDDHNPIFPKEVEFMEVVEAYDRETKRVEFNIDFANKLNLLKDDEIDLLYKLFYEGKKGRVIAKELGIAESQVSSKKRAALHKLHGLLKDWAA